MVMKYISFIILVFFSLFSFAQELTGAQLLDKAIKYHDPNGNWSTFEGNLSVTMKTPDKNERVSEITINLIKEYFQVTSKKNGSVVKQTLDKDNCHLTLNGKSTISEEEQKKHGLSCERAKMFKNYYTYLYGLPMKLKDKGTLVDPKTRLKKFKGKEYLVLKVNYKQDVGKDTWYFYFDPKTYAMKVYQFFHDETINDGEYILLSDELEYNQIKLPQNRAWYYNKNDQHLGTDILTKASPL